MWAADWQTVFRAILQPIPLISIMLGMGILFFVAFALGYGYGARKFSRKNMPAESQRTIDELALRLHDSEAERVHCKAENRVLWARHNAQVCLATKPLEFEQERLLLETEIPLKIVKAKRL